MEEIARKRELQELRLHHKPSKVFIEKSKCLGGTISISGSMKRKYNSCPLPRVVLIQCVQSGYMHV